MIAKIGEEAVRPMAPAKPDPDPKLPEPDPDPAEEEPKYPVSDPDELGPDVINPIGPDILPLPTEARGSRRPSFRR